LSGNLNRAFFIAGILLYLLFAIHFINYAPDDAFISLRYAENLSAGDGLVFNSGHRVEGYSNFFWVIFLSGFAAVMTKSTLVLTAKLTGIIAGFFALLVIGIISKKQFEDNGRGKIWGLAPFAFGFALYPAFWSASGMETGQYLLLLTISILGFFKFLTKPSPLWSVFSAILFLSVGISRPEGVIFFIVAAVALLIEAFREKRKITLSVMIWLGTFLVLYLAFYLWRYSYFGQWLPNTFYAKAGGGLAKYAEGIRYLILNLPKLFWGNAVLSAIPALPFIMTKKPDTKTTFLGLAVLAQCSFVVFAGGDWMPGGRFLVPIMPVVALLLPLGVHRLINSFGAVYVGGYTVFAKALIAIIILITASVHLYNGKQARHDTSGLKEYEGEVFFKPHHFEVAAWLMDHGSKDDLVAIGEAGLIPYITNMPALDLFGLMDPHLAKLPGLRHAKFDGDYVFKKDPRFIVLGGCKVLGDRVTSDFEYARALLNDKRLYDRYAKAFVYHTFIVYQK